MLLLLLLRLDTLVATLVVAVVVVADDDEPFLPTFSGDDGANNVFNAVSILHILLSPFIFLY
ncbi:hypothetical protein AAHE18_08G167700 [Arachis hypogaea]